MDSTCSWAPQSVYWSLNADAARGIVEVDVSNPQSLSLGSFFTTDEIFPSLARVGDYLYGVTYAAELFVYEIDQGTAIETFPWRPSWTRPLGYWISPPPEPIRGTEISGSMAWIATNKTLALGEPRVPRPIGEGIRDFRRCGCDVVRRLSAGE